MRFFTLSLLLIAAGCEFGLIQAPLKQANHSFLSDCDRPDLAQASAILADALCGTLDVLENPENPVGRVIPLNIMLLPATSTVTKPDPIFFLAGGPGQSAVDAGVFIFSSLDETRRERDVVLVDQRGTGRSHPLSCDFSDENHNFIKTSDQSLETSIRQMKACLMAYDADPAYYTTPIAMDDLN